MSRSFLKNPSPRYRQAVHALGELLAASGEDAVQRAFAEAMSEYIERGFARQFKVIRSKAGHVCYMRLKNGKCKDTFENPCPSPYGIPAMDHVSEWKQNKKTDMIVSQPYGLSYEALKETVEFCEKMGLEADISANHSWHFPSWTLLVKYTRAAL